MTYDVVGPLCLCDHCTVQNAPAELGQPCSGVAQYVDTTCGADTCIGKSKGCDDSSGWCVVQGLCSKDCEASPVCGDGFRCVGGGCLPECSESCEGGECKLLKTAEGDHAEVCDPLGTLGDRCDRPTQCRSGHCGLTPACDNCDLVCRGKVGDGGSCAKDLDCAAGQCCGDHSCHTSC